LIGLWSICLSHILTDKQSKFWMILIVGKWFHWWLNHSSSTWFSTAYHSIAAAPPFSGLRRFKQGRGFKQWTGDDSKALMKVKLAQQFTNMQC
jgi:hypothetical protein